MKTVMQMSTKPENLVIDACDETSSVAKTCILFQKQKALIPCKADPKCATEAMPQLIVL